MQIPILCSIPTSMTTGCGPLSIVPEEQLREDQSDLAKRGGAGVDLTEARRLPENVDVAFMGDTKGGPFENAEAEFREAHQHYRHRRYEEANAGCLKALESTLKVICHSHLAPRPPRGHNRPRGRAR